MLLKEIYKELAAIRKELQTIRGSLEQEKRVNPVQICRQGVEEAFEVLFRQKEGE